MTANTEFLALIEAAKRLNHLPSDKALDRACGVTNQVCRWKQGHYFPEDETATRLAQLAGRDPCEVVALVGLLNAEKRQHEAAAATWRNVLRRLAVSLSVTLLVLPAVTPKGADASIKRASFDPPAQAETIHYATMIRRRWRLFVSLFVSRMTNTGGPAYA